MAQAVRLTWSLSADDGTDVDHYSIKRGTSSPPTAEVGTVAAGVGLYDDTTVVEGTTYYYAVTAIDAAGNESPTSNEVSVAVPATVPPIAGTASLTAPSATVSAEEAVAGGGTYSDAVLADSPLLYWQLNEASGASAADSANANDGTYAGVSYGLTGPFAGTDAVEVDGTTSSYIKRDALGLGTDFVIEFWYKLSVQPSVHGTTTSLLSLGSPTAGNFYRVSVTNAGVVRMYSPLSNGSYYITSATKDDTDWHHVAVGIRATGGIYFAVDGVEYTDPDEVTGTDPSGWPLYIGAVYYSGAVQSGTGQAVRFSDVSVYDTFLAASEMIDHYAVATGSSNVDPVADFSYDQDQLTLNFTDESIDSDGTLTNWSWDFGDGNTSTAQNPTYAYASAGTYTVSLTVTDDGGAQHTVNKTVKPYTLGTVGAPTQLVEGAFPRLYWDGVQFKPFNSFDVAGNQLWIGSGATAGVSEEIGSRYLALTPASDRNSVVEEYWRDDNTLAPLPANGTSAPTSPLVNQHTGTKIVSSNDLTIFLIDDNMNAGSGPYVSHWLDHKSGSEGFGVVNYNDVPWETGNKNNAGAITESGSMAVIQRGASWPSLIVSQDRGRNFYDADTQGVSGQNNLSPTYAAIGERVWCYWTIGSNSHPLFGYVEEVAGTPTVFVLANNYSDLFPSGETPTGRELLPSPDGGLLISTASNGLWYYDPVGGGLATQVENVGGARYFDRVSDTEHVTYRLSLSGDIHELTGMTYSGGTATPTWTLIRNIAFPSNTWASGTAPAATAGADGSLYLHNGAEEYDFDDGTGVTTVVTSMFGYYRAGHALPDAAGEAVATGTASLTAPNATFTSTGTLPIGASSSLSAASGTVSAAGSLAITGVSALAAPQGTLSAFVEQAIRGVITITGPSANLSASGEILTTGESSVQTSTATFSAQGVVNLSATSDTTAPSASVSGQASVLVEGVSSLSAPRATFSAVGTATPDVFASLQAASATFSAEGNVPVSSDAVSLVASPVTLSAEGVLPLDGVADLSGSTATLSSSAKVRITGATSLNTPAAKLQASVDQITGGELTLTAPSPALSASGVSLLSGNAEVSARSATVDGAATVRIVGTSDLTADVSQLSASGELTVTGASDVTAVSAAVSATAKSRTLGTTAVTSSAVTFSASGAVTTNGAASIGAPSAQSSAQGDVLLSATFSKETRPSYFSASGTVANTATASVTAASALFNATAGAVAVGTANLTGSSQTFSATGRTVISGASVLLGRSAQTTFDGRTVVSGQQSTQGNVALFGATGTLLLSGEFSIDAAGPAIFGTAYSYRPNVPVMLLTRQTNVALSAVTNDQLLRTRSIHVNLTID